MLRPHRRAFAFPGPFHAVVATTGSLAGAPVAAAPPVWETDFGSPLPGLMTASESERTLVDLPFAFRFGDAAYTEVWVYVGGLVTLGQEQALPSQPDPDDLSDLEQPTAAVFWCDLSTEEGGTVWSNVSTDRAVFTWDAVLADSADDDDGFDYTFQIQLRPDGTIIFGYDGQLLLGDEFLNSELIVGVSDSSSGGEHDFAFEIPFEDSSNTIYESWPENEASFTLEDRNVVFVPRQPSGFVVLDSPGEPGGPRLCADLNGDGTVTQSDFFAWVNAFALGDDGPVCCD